MPVRDVARETPNATELLILKQLWRAGQLSARELHGLTEPTTGWSYSSTRKTLARMAEKGLIDAADFHGLRIYRAAAGKVPTLAALARQFAETVLESRDPFPAAAFVPGHALTDAELAELESLLGEATAGSGRR